jgi:uncharacterized protein YkwD
MSRLPRLAWSQRLVAAATLLTVSFAPSLARPVAAEALQLPSDSSVMTVEQTMLDLTNADRVANGLPALEFDADTLAIARSRAAGQLGTESLSHYDGNGELAFVNMLDDAHLSYQLAGENLARSSASDNGATQRLESALMESPMHRQNILGSFNKVAIGTATNPQGQIVFAEIFRSAD